MRKFLFLLLIIPAINLPIVPSALAGELVHEESLSGTGKREVPVSIPKEYGKLVSVVESGGVHYLYFQDDEGTVRIVLIGIKGSASRAKTDLEALPHSVYKISRASGSSEE